MTRARSHAAHRLKLTRTGFFLVFEGGGHAGGEERSGRLLVELHGLTGARRNINDFEFVQLLFACHHMRGGSESNVLRSTGASSVRVCECTDVLGHVQLRGPAGRARSAGPRRAGTDATVTGRVDTFAVLVWPHARVVGVLFAVVPVVREGTIAHLGPQTHTRNRAHARTRARPPTHQHSDAV